MAEVPLKNTELHTQSPASADLRRKGSDVRPGVILLSVPLIVANSFWLFANWGTSGYASGQSFATIISLFYNVVFCMVILMAINAFLRRYMPKLALRPAEMVTLYILLTIGSVMAGHDSTQILWPLIAYPFWFATPENGWTAFLPHMPDALTVKDKTALTDYFVGHSTLYTWEHIGIWFGPVLLWSVIIIILTLMMLCIVVLLAERWTRHEKLAFPIVQLPLAMMNENVPFFKNRLMWMGFAIAAGANLMNGLHLLYPSIPGSGGNFLDIAAWLPGRPWTAIGWTPVAVFPFAVGMSFFIPLDLSFSIWFFYVITKMSLVVGDSAGLTADPRFPYPILQSAGAWLGLITVALWTSRSALKMQFLHALNNARRSEGEAFSARTAMLGLSAGSVILIILGWMAGISPVLSIIYLLLFFAIGAAIMRVRAELGPPSHDFMSEPLMIMTTIVGSGRLGAPVLTLLTLMNSLNRAYRAHPMPSMLEGFAMSSRKGMDPRRLLAGIIIAVVVGTISSAWAHFYFSYKYGAAVYGEQAQCWWFFDKLTAWCRNPASPDTGGIAAMGVGGTVVFGLMALRHRFPWWPLHPAGYALALSPWNATWYSMSVMIGWLLKFLIMRYGGLKLYSKSMPFFMGIVLGDLMMGAIWSLIGISMKMPMYRFLF